MKPTRVARYTLTYQATHLELDPNEHRCVVVFNFHPTSGDIDPRHYGDACGCRALRAPEPLFPFVCGATNLDDVAGPASIEPGDRSDLERSCAPGLICEPATVAPAMTPKKVHSHADPDVAVLSLCIPEGPTKRRQAQRSGRKRHPARNAAGATSHQSASFADNSCATGKEK